MEISIDPDSSVAIYLQIVSSIKHLVATARLKPAEQLPTVRELAADLRINPNTVARAYDQLDRDKVISTQQGRGTFVRERPNKDLLTRMRHEHLVSLMTDVISISLSQGYSIVEIDQTFDIALKRWAEIEGGGKPAESSESKP